MNRLKELRKEKGLTQQGLADEMEVSKRTYIYWENGESQIKPDKAQQLADYFGVSVGYLLGYGYGITFEDIGTNKLTQKLDKIPENEFSQFANSPEGVELYQILKYLDEVNNLADEKESRKILVNNITRQLEKLNLEDLDLFSKLVTSLASKK